MLFCSVHEFGYHIPMLFLIVPHLSDTAESSRKIAGAEMGAVFEKSNQRIKAFSVEYLEQIGHYERSLFLRPHLFVGEMLEYLAVSLLLPRNLQKRVSVLVCFGILRQRKIHQLSIEFGLLTISEVVKDMYCFLFLFH